MKKLSKSKSRNLPKFSTKKARPSFLTFNAKKTFNCLKLVFIKTLIFQQFDSEYHIWIKTEVLGYAISRMLNQLIFKTNPNKVFTKTNLG